MQGVSPPQGQGLVLGLQEYHASPFLQPVEVPLNGSPAAKHIDCCPQRQHSLWGTPSPTLVIAKRIKQKKFEEKAHLQGDYKATTTAL